MPDYRYIITDVFTDRPFGGNPLAVFPDAAGLTTAQMQVLTKELNLSETTFVTQGSAPGRFAVRIFTPGNEMAFAGHPTIGTALVLASLGRAAGEVVLELGVGPVRVVLDGANATFYRDGPPESPALSVTDAEFAAVLGVDRLAAPAFQAGYGAAFIYVPLVDRDAVARAELRLDLWRNMAARVWGHAIYLYAVTAATVDHLAIHARLFAPGLGVGEDPATGSAAAGLVGSLPGPADGVLRATITQGVEIGRPSTIGATATRVGGTVSQISISGGAVVVGEGRFTTLP